MTCPFCDNKQIIISNQLAFAIFDKYPVSEGHMLIIPYRHISSYFDLSDEEKIAILELANAVKDFLNKKFSPVGFNLGFNIGECAGQTIMHAHCHLIPRYKGDVLDPRGGIRGVIPNRKLYD